MKYVSLLIFIFFSAPLSAEVAFYWGGITAVTITDDQNTIMFDPVFNRPPLLSIPFNGTFHIDENITQMALDRMNIKKVDGIFSSHTHHDHFADAPLIAQKTGATIYGSQTSKYLALSSHVPGEQVQIMEVFKTYHFGSFQVTPLPSGHPKLLNLFEFLPGELNEKVSYPIKIWNYKMGGSYCFLVKHPKFTALLHKTSHIHPAAKKYLKEKGITVDVLFQGIANRNSTEDQDKNLWSIIKPKIIVPVHHDNFLFQTNFKEVELLPLSVNKDEFVEYTKQKNLNVLWPNYFEKLSVLQ